MTMHVKGVGLKFPDGTEQDTAALGGAIGSDAYTKAETDAKLATKANVGVSYTKAETDNLVNNKANNGVSYTKAETETRLATKANVGDSYTKSQTYSKGEVDTRLNTKSDKSNTYTKAEIDAMKGSSAYINVKDWGAKGDGSANDAPAIQNAINSMPSGTVYFPAGDYKINAQINLKPGVVLYTERGRQTTITAGSNSMTMLNYRNTSGVTTIGIAISGFTLSSGGRSNVNGIKVHGYESGGTLARVSWIQLEDIQCVNLLTAVDLFLTANSFISDIFCSACTNGIKLTNCADTGIVNCKVQNGSGIGYNIKGDGAVDGAGGSAYDEGTDIVNCTTNGQAKGIVIEKADWGQVANCSFTTAPDGAVTTIGRNTNWKFTNCNITSNDRAESNQAGAQLSSQSDWFSFTNCFFALNTFGLVGRGDVLLVNGCTFNANKNVDIYLAGTNTTITGNVFVNGAVTNSIVEDANANRTNITGNILNKGIALQGSSSVETNNINP